MTTCRILGLVGATGSGKTTLARELVKHHGFANVHIGRPLKDMLVALGLTESDVSGSPEQRCRAQPLLGGKSARDALSSLGTDWGRNMISPDIWANAARLRIEQHFKSDPATPIVVDDLRFPNDWSVITQASGMIIAVRRPSTEAKRSLLDVTYHRLRMSRFFRNQGFCVWHPLHETEFHWRDAPIAGEVWNIGSVEQLVVDTMTYWVKAESAPLEQ